MTERDTYLEMAFDRDGYFGTQNRHLFAASMWLQALIESQTDWPEAAQALHAHLSGLDRSSDHIKSEIAKARNLLEPWLSLVRDVDIE